MNLLEVNAEANGTKECVPYVCKFEGILVNHTYRKGKRRWLVSSK
jgi:hypothetical protein